MNHGRKTAEKGLRQKSPKTPLHPKPSNSLLRQGISITLGSIDAELYGLKLLYKKYVLKIHCKKASPS